MAEYAKIPIVQFERRALAASAEAKFFQKLRSATTLKLNRPPNFLAFNQKRKAFYYGTDMVVHSLDLKSLSPTTAYTKERVEISAFKLRKDGNLAAFATVEGEAKILSLMHRSILKQWKLSKQAIGAVDLLDKKSLAAFGANDGSVFVYDFAAEVELLKVPSLHGDFIRKVLFVHDDGSQLITGALDKKVCLVDLKGPAGAAMVFGQSSEVVDIQLVGETQFICAGGKEVALWDIRNCQQPLAQVTAGAKSVSGLRLVGDKLLVGSLDCHMRSYSLADGGMALLHQQNFGKPIAGFAVGLVEDSSFKTLAISFVDGSMQVYTKSVEEKDLEVETDRRITPQEKLLLKYLSVGYSRNEMSGFQYFNRGIWGAPESFTAKIAKPAAPHFQQYDRLLRKFRYSEALQAALETSNTNIILSVIEELVVRDGLLAAFRGLDDPTLTLLLAFFHKKIDSVNCQKIVAFAFEACLDALGDRLSAEAKFRPLLVKIDAKLVGELQNVERCCMINAMLDRYD